MTSVQPEVAELIAAAKAIIALVERDGYSLTVDDFEKFIDLYGVPFRDVRLLRLQEAIEKAEHLLSE